jgi:hypothetical protein
MNAFLTAAVLLFAASLLIANPAAFLRLTDDFTTGIRRFGVLVTGRRDPYHHLALAPANLAAVRAAGIALALVGLAICALA